MDKFRKFMENRYGSDDLSRFLVRAAAVLFILSILIRSLSVFFYGAGMILVLYGLYRMLSKNIARRREENLNYLDWIENVKSRFGKDRVIKKDKEHCYFKCPQCGQKVRVPRNRGAIKIHCPKCHADFIRRT